jgi:hypothetical protein
MIIPRHLGAYVVQPKPQLNSKLQTWRFSYGGSARAAVFVVGCAYDRLSSMAEKPYSHHLRTKMPSQAVMWRIA